MIAETWWGRRIGGGETKVLTRAPDATSLSVVPELNLPVLAVGAAGEEPSRLVVGQGLLSARLAVEAVVVPDLHLHDVAREGIVVHLRVDADAAFDCRDSGHDGGGEDGLELHLELMECVMFGMRCDLRCVMLRIRGGDDELESM